MKIALIAIFVSLAAYGQAAPPSGGGGSATVNLTVNAVGSSPNSAGASASGTALTLQPADGTHPGVITSGTQTIGGAKTLSGGITLGASGITFNDATTLTTATMAGDVTGTPGATVLANIPGSVTASSTTGTAITSSTANSGTNVAFTLKTTNTLSGSTVFQEWVNNATELMRLTNGGILCMACTGDDGTAAKVQAGSLSTRGGTIYTGRVEVSGNNALGLRSNMSNGNAASAFSITTVNSLTNTASSILSLVNSATTKRTFSISGKDIFPTGAGDAVVGTATLSGGTVTVSTTSVTASSKIFLSHAGSATTNAGFLSQGTIVAATSFVINSTNASDTDTVNWWIVN